MPGPYLSITRCSKIIGSSLFLKVYFCDSVIFLEGEVAVLKTHTTVPDDFLDSEKPIRSDWPSVFVSECYIEGEKAKLHGSARPLRSFLPPSIVFRSAADIDDDLPEPELPASSALGPESGLEIVSTNEGLAIRKMKERESSYGNLVIY